MGSTTGPATGSIKKGEVRAVRELRAGVQAQVCLGADPATGYATIEVVCAGPEVMAAMTSLKQALQREARGYVRDVLAGQAEWDQEMGR